MNDTGAKGDVKSQEPEARVRGPAGRDRGPTAEIPEWWAVLPQGERTLIRAVVRMLRSAKRSQLREVARAAAKWERGIGCFIKVRLMHSFRRAPSGRASRRPPRLVDSGWVRIEGRDPGNGKRDA